MKKTLTKFLAIVLSVCVLLSTPVFAALAESYCPIESVSVTFSRPMYENTDGYWIGLGDSPDDLFFYDDPFFYYEIEDYVRTAATINIEYDDGTIENLTLNEIMQREEFDYNLGDCEEGQYEVHWEVGDEIEAYFHLRYVPSDTRVYNYFNVTLEETPIESMTAVATKSLVENISGDADWDGTGSSYYKYDPALTEPTFTIKWKDTSKADTTVSFAEVEKTLCSPAPIFSSNQNSENEWVAGGSYTATASVLGAECDFEVDVISLDVTSISAKATHKAILGVDEDMHWGWDDETEQNFNFLCFDCSRFYPEITLTFENGESTTIKYSEFESKTNSMYSLWGSSNQSLKTPWNKAGNYSFEIELSVNDNPDFEPLTCTMPVEVVVNPIEKIEVVATEPSNANNYSTESEYDYITDEYLEYKYYYDIGSPKITVYYTDGTVKGSMYPYELVELFDNKYQYSFYTDQSYENQWDLGKNQVSLDFMGHTVKYDVLLAERFVKSIKVVDAKVSDHDIYYDEFENLYYDLDNVRLEITLWDDSKVVETVRSNEWFEYGEIKITYDQISNPWYEGGENEFTVTLIDKFGAEITTTGNAEITEYFAFNYSYENDGANIYGYHGSKTGVLEIPEEIYGEPVVAISNLYSYDENEDLVTGLVIPDSVKSISDYALEYFDNLESIELGSGLAYIPDGFGAGNENLKTLTVSSENTDYYSVNNAIFTKDKTKLVAVAPACGETIKLPAECTDINVLYDYAFEYKNVKIGYEISGDYNVKENGIVYSKDKKTVISCDTEKTGSVVLPNTVTKINRNAFNSCSKITSVTVPNSVTEIVYGTFADCTSLKTVNLSSELTEIGEWAFAGCTSLTSITLPNKLESINSAAFRDSGLKSITIPDSVTWMSDEVFTRTPIETAKLGSGLKVMGTSFYECEKLKSVNIPAGIEDFKYAFSWCESLNSVIFENGLDCISQGAFNGCTALTSISLPSSLTYISTFAFYETGLKSVTIPNSVEELGAYSFGFCKNLTTVTLGSGLTEVGEMVFEGSGVKNINWGANLESISYRSFANSELESVEIPNTVTSVMYYSFIDSSKLSNIKIPKSVQSVGEQAFDGTAWYNAQAKGATYIDDVLYRYKGDVTAPTTINIKNGTRLIGDCAFEHISFEEDMYYKEECEEWDQDWWYDDLYYDLSGITRINIPESVTNIGSYAFCGLPSITEITLPDSLKIAGEGLFVGCENLEKVDIGKSTAIISGYDFASTPAMKQIIVDPQNTAYTVVDGVLYSKDMTKLIYCPAGKTGELIVPLSVREIDNGAFDTVNLSSITFLNPEVVISDEYYCDFDDVLLKATKDSTVEVFANNYGYTFESIAMVEEVRTGITVSETVDNAIPDGAELVVESVEPTEENTVVFDITLECDGDAVQPEAPVTVKIPLPVGIDAQLCKVYRLEEDGSKTDMKATVVNGNIYFTTEHFSLYVIESSFLPGDVDGSGEVDLLDVVALSQIIAEWENVDHIVAALDPNGDGEVTLLDVVTLAQFVAEWDVVLSDTAYSAE